MRLTAQVLAGLLLAAVNTHAQQINLSIRNAPIQAVFSEIEKQTNYTFYYQSGILDSALPVTVNVQKASLEKALGLCFAGQPLTWTIIQQTIVVKRKSDTVPPVSAGAYTVSGLVTDDQDTPLPGVSVSIKETSIGTQTDEKGRFTINVPDAHNMLLLSYIGFNTTSYKLKGPAFISIQLRRSDNQLEEVTVINTGYQTLPKERSAGAFSSANMETVANRSYSMNVLQRVDGLIPGLTVNNAPSSSQNPFLIRGLNTIGIKTNPALDVYAGVNRNPLVVIDGIPTDDLSFLNPQDVRDITVLKDAMAASIWGARASNGVIVITTKKGSRNQSLRVSYDGFATFSSRPDINYFPTLNSAQYVQAAKEIFDPVVYPWDVVSAYTLNSPAVTPHEQILYDQYRGLIPAARAQQLLDSLGAIDNRAQIKQFWSRPGMLTNHTVSFSGGGKGYSIYGSAGYTGTLSHTPGETNDQYKLNLRQDFQFNDRISVYLITDLTHGALSAKRPVAVDARFYPYQLFRAADGTNLSMPWLQGISDSARTVFESLSKISLDYNPLDEFNRGYTASQSLNARVIGGLTLQLIKGLRFEGLYGFIRSNTRSTSFDDESAYIVRREVANFTEAGSGAPVYHLPNTGGWYSVGNTNGKNWTVRNQLLYDNSWNNRRHQLTMLVGQEAQERLTQYNSSKLRGYNEQLQTYQPVDYATLTSNGLFNAVLPNAQFFSILTDDLFTSTEALLRFNSYYGNAAYTYAGKYTLNGSWRLDKSNLFGKDKSAQNKPTYSMGLRWDLGKEDFIKNTTWLDRLALRTTYGITGNSPNPGTGSSYDILQPEKSNFFIGGVGLTLSTAANKKLSWERTVTYNLGLDFSLWHSRLSGSIDGYLKKTSNLIGDLAVNSFTGFSTVVGNFGALQNKGIELQLNSLNFSAGAFSWSTLLTLAYNKNKITRMNSLIPVTTGDDMVARNYLGGYPAFSIFAYRFAGLDDQGDPQIRLSDKSITKTPHVSSASDIAYMGTYQPVWSGGLSNIFRYKLFSLTINMIYNLGHVMRRDANTFYSDRLATNFNNYPYLSGNVSAEFAQRWKQPGDEQHTNIPSYVSSSSLSASRRQIAYYTNGDLNVVSASYIKVRDIGISCSLPQSLIRSLRMHELVLRMQVSNIMLWKANHYGIDPEFQDAFNGIRTLPVDQHALSIGMHLTF